MFSLPAYSGDLDGDLRILPTLVLADALPHQPGAADLEEGGDDEQGNGTSDGHTRDTNGGPRR
ncbi:hypothetical protein GCM10010381_65380 [Streptomyces xantholiticus]|nr:hypothetical protein GCM10010381_65380 [Streptomyces xantholiticus]